MTVSAGRVPTGPSLWSRAPSHTSTKEDEAGALPTRRPLPRFVLERGRLHSFRTRPWNRAPGPDEGYMTVSMTPLRP